MSARPWLILLLCSAAFESIPCRGADIDFEEIVRRANATLQSDWHADPDYAYVERDEVQKKETVTSKTSQVVYIAGSDYYLPLAIDDKLLAPDRKKAELQNLKNEVQSRSSRRSSFSNLHN